MGMVTVHDNEFEITEDLDTLSGTSGGNAYDIPLGPYQTAAVIIEVTTVNAIADGVDSVLALDGKIKNSYGKIVDDLGDNFVAFCTKVSGGTWSSTTPWEYFTSGSAGAKQVDILTVVSTHGKGCVLGHQLNLTVQADTGADDWNDGTTGTLKVKVRVTPFPPLHGHPVKL